MGQIPVNVKHVVAVLEPDFDDHAFVALLTMQCRDALKLLTEFEEEPEPVCTDWVEVRR
jgi:hypothetical protein